MANDCCYYCGIEYGTIITGCRKPTYKTNDHIIPVSKKGNNLPMNKVSSCDHCNGLKGNMLPNKFRYWLINRIEKIQTGELRKQNKFYLERLVEVHKNNNKLIKQIEPYKHKLLKGYVPTEEEKHGVRPVSKKKIKNPFAEPKKKKLKEVIKELGFIDIPVSVQKEIHSSQFTQPLGYDLAKMLEDSKGYSLFLQHQTPEQFQIAKQHGWKIAKLLTEPEPNFHYE